MRIGIAKRVLATMLAVVALATPMQAEAKTKAKTTPRYVDRVAVVGVDYSGRWDRSLNSAVEKYFLVFTEDGQIHRFDADFANRYSAGQTVNLHMKTQRTKKVTDDVVLDTYKVGLKAAKFEDRDVIRNYSLFYKNQMDTIRIQWEHYRFCNWR